MRYTYMQQIVSRCGYVRKPIKIIEVILKNQLVTEEKNILALRK